MSHANVSIKELVTDKKVNFELYRKGELWYTTECGFKFPVPIEDTGDASFLSEDKAIYFMRFIKKHLRALQAAD